MPGNVYPIAFLVSFASCNLFLPPVTVTVSCVAFSFPDKLLALRKFGSLTSVQLNLMQRKMEQFILNISVLFV